MVNVVVLAGSVAADPVQRRMPSGDEVTHIRLSTDPVDGRDSVYGAVRRKMRRHAWRLVASTSMRETRWARSVVIPSGVVCGSPLTRQRT
jgi:hypothetical protein